MNGRRAVAQTHGAEKARVVGLLCVVALLQTGPPAAIAGPSLPEIQRLNKIGRFSQAEQAARVQLAETEKRMGSESLETAEVLDELAVALRRGGKVEEPEAKAICERALSIKERTVGIHDARYAASLHNLGLLMYQRGELDSAATQLERALQIRMETLGGSHADVALSLLAVGSVQQGKGYFPSAKAALERAVEIQKTALTPGDPERAYGLNALGSLDFEVGACSSAIPLLEEAIALWEKFETPNLPMLGSCYHNLGCVYTEIGDDERALRTLQRALQLRENSLGAQDPLVAATLVVLGDELSKVDDPSGARSRFLRALRIEEQAYGRDHPSVGWTRMKLGRLDLTTGHPARAGAMLRRAREIQEKSLGSDHPDLWQTLLGLAEVAKAEGDISGARAYFKRTLEILEKAYGASNIDLGGALNRYAEFLLEVRDSSSALDTSLRAAQVNGEQLRLISHGLAERQALAYASMLGSSLDVALAVLAGEPYRSNPSAVRAVWGAVIPWRALVLDEVASRNRSVNAAEGLAENARRLKAARQRLANLLVRGPTSSSPDRYQALTDSAREEVEHAERDLGAMSAPFFAERTIGQIGLSDVLTALPPATALVAFVGYGTPAVRSTIAFILARDRQPAAVWLGSTREIDALVSRWTALIRAGSAEAGRSARIAENSCRKAGKELRIRIWDPLLPYITDARRVFVVPEGSLHLVNLAALPEGSSEYVVESGPLLHYLSAERDLVPVTSDKRAGEGLLALGGPSFDRQEGLPAPDSPGSARAAGSAAPDSATRVFRSAPPDCDDFRHTRFGPLPEAAQEVREIAANWEKSDETLILTGSSATERAFKERAPGRRVIHIASHGFFLNGRCGRPSRSGTTRVRGIGGLAFADRPSPRPKEEANPLLLSGIALAGANGHGSPGPDEEDGILTAEEIASIDLSRTEWAVLSACDTGVGEIQAGEGVLGLRRAFQVAGASTLIMSLWAVEDRSAREWMRLLYGAKFRRKLETDEAVREASLGVLRERRARAESTHPFYWAGFVAAGDWR